MQKSVLKKFINCIKKKQNASSLMEVIVALAICMIIFGISMAIITNSQRNNNIELKLKSQFLLSLASDIIADRDSATQEGPLRMETTVESIDSIPGTSRLSYSVFDNAGHKLGLKIVWAETSNRKELEDGISNNID